MLHLRVMSLARLIAAGALAWASGVAAPATAQTPSAPGVPVQVAAVARQDVPILLRNIGAVQAYEQVLVRARVDGTLDKVFFREGQDVKAGDPLALIDPRPYQAALDQATAKKTADQALLANAERDLARYANLARSDFASHQQVDTQQAMVAEEHANIAADDAAIANARLNLEFAHITSPIDGRTGLRLIDPGNLVHASDSQGIVSVAQIHPIAVVFTLPQETLPQVQAAMARGTLPVQAFTPDNATLLGSGHLLTVDNAIDPTTGTYKLKAEFPNADNALWPGQFVNTSLEVGTLAKALAVPSVAVQRGPAGMFVYVVKPDGTAAMQPVVLAQDDGVVAVVARGLDEGAQVVTNGMSRLQNGSPVLVSQKAGT